MTGEGTLEFRLLGPLEARVENRLLPLGGVRQRGLLALLLLRANEVVSRDRLIDELWRDHAPETAANALAALVSRLRRVLPSDVLVTRAGGYEAQVDREAIDLYRFQQLAEDGSHALAAGDPAGAADLLRSGLALWRGSALADFTYEPFAEPVILRLEELRLAAVENRIDADLALGRHGELVGELQSLVLEHPLRERLRGQLMLALYRSGRQAEALEVYRDGRHALLDELGIDPSPALQELEQAILRQDRGVRAPEPVSTADSAPPIAAHHEQPAAGEMRPVTILFADIVGSAALAERLAPDEVFGLIGGCVTLMSLAVEEYGGTVQAYEGDSICVYFGVPSAHKDDPERAARAALRILELVERVRTRRRDSLGDLRLRGAGRHQQRPSGGRAGRWRQPAGHCLRCGDVSRLATSERRRAWDDPRRRDHCAPTRPSVRSGAARRDRCQRLGDSRRGFAPDRDVAV